MSRFFRLERAWPFAMAFLVLPGCNEDEEPWESFDGPIDVSVLEPNEIIDVPVGFVSNYRSGKIDKMDLLHDTPLQDRPEGSWIRSMPIATGRDRMLEQLTATYAYVDASDYYITLFASDSLRDQLLVVPYIDSRATWGPECVPDAPSCIPGTDMGNGTVCGPQTGFIPRYPICIPQLAGQLSAGQTVRDGVLEVLGPDGAATGFSVRDFWLREGKTSTETWTGTYDVSRGYFVIRGSRSGVQERIPTVGETYWSDDNEVEFVIEGDGTAGSPPDGATFSFDTDSGIQEIPMGGIIQDLRISETQKRLFVTVQANDSLDGGIVQGWLVVVDLEPLSLRESLAGGVEEIPLCPVEVGSDEVCPVASLPMAMELDSTHQRLFVSEESDEGVLYQIDLSVDPLEPVIKTGFQPNLDVAYVEDPESEDGYQHLFVANLDEGTISLYDLKTETMLDVNPFTPEVDPVRLYSPVQGLGTSRVAVQIPERNDDQVSKRSILVAATTFKGDLIPIQGENGCQMFATERKAYVDSDSASFTDQGSTSNPGIDNSAETGEMAVLNACGGIARNETWRFTFDEAIGGYRVRGNRTNKPGEYERNIAYEDQRYVSDAGEISVVIRAGTLPTTDGDTFSLTVAGNVLPISVGQMPADVVTYTQGYGDRTEEWTPVSFHTLAVVPSALSDGVYKVDLAKPNTDDASWVFYQ